MNMNSIILKRIALLIIGVMMTLISYGQKIEINSNGLFINSKKITSQTSTSNIQSLLGTPDRKFLKFNTIWTYDDIGVRIYINPENGKLKSISLDFKKANYDFSPISTFSGEFLIHGFNISMHTPIVSLKKLPELTFDNSPFQVYSATTNYLTLTLQYLDDVTQLEAVGISFR